MKKHVKPITITKKSIVNLSSNPNREIKIFGKEFKGLKAVDIKTDIFTKEQREIFDDLVYAKKRMTKSEIESLPLIKKYRVKVLSIEVEKTLNKWKSEIVNSTIDNLLLKLFPNSKLVKDITNVEPSNVDYIETVDFNIHKMFTEVEIAEYLSSKNLFPKLNK